MSSLRPHPMTSVFEIKAYVELRHTTMTAYDGVSHNVS